VKGLEVKGKSLGFRVQRGEGFRVQRSLGFRVQKSLGFRVQKVYTVQGSKGLRGFGTAHFPTQRASKGFLN